jgi:Domain of unknown function (DUF4168)
MFRTPIRALNSVGVIAFVLAVSTATGRAQQPQSPASPPPSQIAHGAASLGSAVFTPATASDQQLRAFAKAAIQLQRIAQRTRVSLQAAKTVDARQAVARQLDRQQIQAVMATGLTVSQYNVIASAIRADPRMRMRVDVYLKRYAPGVTIVAASIPR